MTIWVIGLILRPNAHDDAHYMHKDACMQTPLFNEGHYGPFIHVFSSYINQTFGPYSMSLHSHLEEDRKRFSHLLLPSLKRLDVG